jgi:hypothetical protein
MPVLMENSIELEPRDSRIAKFKRAMKANGWLLVATVTYGVSLFALREHPEWGPKLRVGLTLLPMVPGAFYLLALWRSLRHLDELERRIQLEAWAFALGGTVLVSTAINILNANGIGFEGYPHGLQFGGTYLTVFICWSIGTVGATARYR